MAAAAALVLASASVALANAPDPTDGPQVQVGPIVDIEGVDTVRISISGPWYWESHSTDCNTDRTGVGYTMAWDDPNQPGNVVDTISGQDVEVGAAGPNEYNGADNEVHPTRPEVTGTLFNDPGDPASYDSWNGGCGTYDGDHPEGVWGAVDLDTGAPVTCTSEIAPSETCMGASHIYTLAALQDGVTVCVVMYDVHGGDADAGGNPNGEKEVTAGGDNHNTDNTVETNHVVPTGGACVAIVPPDPGPSSSPTMDPGATPDPTNTPDPTDTPEPTASPDPSATPDPTDTPDPSTTPDPSATPDPGATPDPSATPTPTATVDPNGTPDPTQTPGLPETAMTRSGSSGGAPAGPALLIGFMALAIGFFAARRRPIRTRPQPQPAASTGPWSTSPYTRR